MFSEKELTLIKNKGLTEYEIEEQVNRFKIGFPSIQITKAATISNGIKVLKEKKLYEMIDCYEKQSKRLKKIKFVPASGAASRMFKDLFEVMNNYNESEEDYLKIMANREFGSIYYICHNICNFAFFSDLKKVIEKKGSSFEEISKKKDVLAFLKNLLTEQGLNYASLPKGLLKFHRCDDGEKTPVEEHMIEGALYASSNKKVKIHFTVSENHLQLFKDHINDIKEKYETKFKVKYTIDFSLQKQNTDTIAVDLKNEPFRNSNGELVFRPGGHGALIQNLMNLDADIVFVKNIDNVIQSRLQEDTVKYKKALAGILIQTRNSSFEWVKKLKKKRNTKYIEDASLFVRRYLGVSFPDSYVLFSNDKKVEFLLTKLDRPIRVCGMVRNEGEPGGGPFWVENSDGSNALQIVESSQIDESKKSLMKKATHFNPVDLVCSITNYKGKKFNLNNFIDTETGFISVKSYEGKELKALELPGLWNGAMANWNTLFVEVPITTFSPVKTINDLLKTEHLYHKDLLVEKNNEHSVID